MKDLIIYKGYNVYPREFEEVLFQHPAVEQCAVVGRTEMRDGRAAGCLRPAAQRGNRLKRPPEYANSQVAAYKKLREVIFVDAIPVSGAGKVLKRELRDRLKQG